ncbi:MAG TPA: HEAT repeat domain-containing protein [Polyangiaceae bacterium]|nr:HEAT repeat domain-containing protein [Polyangiaceae bacterium]
MNTRTRSMLSCVALGLIASSALAEPAVHAGRAEVYTSLDSDSLERVTSAKALEVELSAENVAPTRIWKLLEHGEKVECLSCIPVVSKLLFDANDKTREISAWWLRRRVFGVFGPGEVYSRVVESLSNSEQSEVRRSYAANAIGEFLNPAGVPLVAKAAVEDTSPRVRLAAVRALTRLNHEGPAQELGTALADSDEQVRLAALNGALGVNVFSSTPAVVERLGDGSASVRRRAAEAVGVMHLADAAMALVPLCSAATEADPNVRAAALWALGQIGDSAYRSVVEGAQGDANPQVKSSARIALRRL